MARETLREVVILENLKITTIVLIGVKRKKVLDFS
tara:strand:- start:9237 stop:9341 length:105 start_codon:yes stop_codon:yes gene_type:complete